MDAKYINPFIDAVDNALETMAGISPDRGNPFLKKDKVARGDVTGIIGFADQKISGSLAVSFPETTILKIFEKMVGTPMDGIDSEVEDFVGEIANIVAGGAKKTFSEMGIPYHISIPMVIAGKDHSIKHKHDTPIIAVPYTAEGNEFNVEICLKVG